MNEPLNEPVNQSTLPHQEYVKKGKVSLGNNFQLQHIHYSPLCIIGQLIISYLYLYHHLERYLDEGDGIVMGDGSGVNKRW